MNLCPKPDSPDDVVSPVAAWVVVDWVVAEETFSDYTQISDIVKPLKSVNRSTWDANNKKHIVYAS